ncbi:thioesterase [Skermania sp. ID1734]|uniref:thioesterase family protein n=1 Tax=Skermania sp. ID1734 TaxID=2597516 RepID=UPI0011806857|nr:hotdog domain-containing protein [Skermania sp. ID1734]TSD98122.1 thioesterase [Skermania sp. ID1734]
MQPGLSARLETVVTEHDTAIALGSGDVPVLGTPRVVALAEEATVQAVKDHLSDGQTSVGVEVLLHHRRASAVGATITVTAELTDVDETRLTFNVEVREGETLVADGTVQRVVVDRAAFVERVGRAN